MDNINNIKNEQIKFEEKHLNPLAAKSFLSKGRKVNEPTCSLRTEFQRDRDRILHSKAFRRLKHKTQVFISPQEDHYRTRITHTLEVSQISRTIARALRLNEDLTEAIALGHDLGHTPFGHSGEEVLNKLLENGFRHNEQSLRVVSLIEPLNLTYETMDGIANHTGSKKPFTLEGQIVKIADRVAYLNHDIDDSIRAGIIKQTDIPKNCIEILGATTNERITTMVIDLIENSLQNTEIIMSDRCKSAMNELREWMFEHVYIGSPAKVEEHKAMKIVEELFSYYMKNFDEIEGLFKYKTQSRDRAVADYIAGMTDRFAIQQYLDKFVPKSWQSEFRQ